jgi:uncharacterized protein YggE
MNMEKHRFTIGIALATVGIVLLVVMLALVISDRGYRAQNGGCVGQTSASEYRNVKVTGTADVKVAPDQVVITLGVETRNSKLVSAKSENDKVVKRVLAVAKAGGVKDDRIQTEYVQINPMYQYESGSSNQSLRGYSATQTIAITLADVQKFEDLLSKLLEAGANYVYDVQFQTTDLRKYKDQARELAIQAAKEKSEALAGELGQRSGQPINVVEEQNTSRSWYGYGWGSRYGDVGSSNTTYEVSGGSLPEGMTVAPGQISVTATVTVTFELK